MRYKVLLSYDGSSFCGWQRQDNAPSVQECLENALSTLLAEKISVTGAGRTDAGVHAIRYAAHFDSFSGRLDAAALGYKLNAILPPSVVVHEVTPAADGFHARFDALSRTYMYFIHKGKDPFADRYSWRCDWPLDTEAMNEAAAVLLGTHDFSCFEKTGGGNKTSVCTVSEAFWRPYQPQEVSQLGFIPAAGMTGEYLVFRITADRFLRNMVRAVVGTLVEVGRGRRSPSSMQALLDSGDRCAAGDSVPGNALFLVNVEYPAPTEPGRSLNRPRGDSGEDA